jgi:hypothetical protein
MSYILSLFIYLLLRMSTLICLNLSYLFIANLIDIILGLFLQHPRRSILTFIHIFLHLFDAFDKRRRKKSAILYIGVLQRPRMQPNTIIFLYIIFIQQTDINGTSACSIRCSHRMLYLIVHDLVYIMTMPQYLCTNYLVVLVRLKMPLGVAEYCYLV